MTTGDDDGESQGGDVVPLTLVVSPPPEPPPPPAPPKIARDHLGRILPGQSGNPGGRKRKVRDMLALLEDKVEAAVGEIGQMLQSPDFDERKFAVETILRWGLGAPPKRAVTTTQELPHSDEARLKALETLLLRFAMDGDPVAMGKSLAALAPEKYGPPGRDDGEGDAPPTTTIRFVPRGEARPANKFKKDDE